MALECLISNIFIVSPEDVSLTYKIFAKILQGVNMTKNIMSIAAAAAIITSGASAFETNVDGNLTNIDGTQGAYQSANLSAPSPVITINGTQFGDALIFPAFNQRDSWGTEIVVRNTEKYAIVAKFVAYSGKDSQELRDFNVYLSANDVFRCTIQNGMITTTDDSVHVGGWGEFEGVTLPEEAGYVVVYAMAADLEIDGHGPASKIALKASYDHTLLGNRKVDVTQLTDLLMAKGVYVQTDVNVTAPRILVADLNDTNLSDPVATSLSGTTRIFNADEPRDLIMPATAVQNYTDGSVMLWAPRELAAFADRNIIGGTTFDVYSKADVVADASAYLIEKAYYTFNNATVDSSESTDLSNKLIVTQPEKRTIVQLGEGDTFWEQKHCTVTAMEDEAASIVNGTEWSFLFASAVWDEEENVHMGEVVTPPELSPGDDNPSVPQARCLELAEIANIEADTDNSEKNGYAVVDFHSGAIPAIVTQMTASQVGDSREINWIKAPVVAVTPVVPVP